MTSSLFLNSIIENNKSGVVTFTLPQPSGEGQPEELKGWLTEIPAYKLGNTWQPAMPSIEKLTATTQVLNSPKETIAWLAGAQSAWVGEEPLTVSITFYLFSKNAKSQIKKDLLKLTGLSVLYSKDSQNSAGIVHGGYKPDILDDNNMAIQSKSTKGFITIRIGSQLTFKKMLLVDVTPEPSILEVPNGNPLYIKVNANFKTYRPITYQELVEMVG